MEARDILRLVLFFVIAIFAIREVLFLKAREIAQLKNVEEKQESSSQQLYQQSKNKGNSIVSENIEYETEIMEYDNETLESKQVSG